MTGRVLFVNFFQASLPIALLVHLLQLVAILQFSLWLGFKEFLASENNFAKNFGSSGRGDYFMHAGLMSQSSLFELGD